MLIRISGKLSFLQFHFHSMICCYWHVSWEIRFDSLACASYQNSSFHLVFVFKSSNCSLLIVSLTRNSKRAALFSGNKRKTWSEISENNKNYQQWYCVVIYRRNLIFAIKMYAKVNGNKFSEIVGSPVSVLLRNWE